MNILEDFKKMLAVLVVLYRVEIRRKLLKVMILLNFIFFVMSVGQNVVSMFIFILNMHYLNNYLQKEYPDEGLKIKDRFKDVIR